MPLVLLKEVENLFKGVVGNFNIFAVKCLKLVFLEDATVEVRDFSEQPLNFSAPLSLRFREPFKEEWTEEFSCSIGSYCWLDSLLVCYGDSLDRHQESFSFG